MYWSLFYLLFVDECWVIELDIGGCWHTVEIVGLGVQEVSGYLASCALATQNSSTYTIRS